jgi:chemosensory pili system protein ChpA (sensor histidine kinase/response regulator)
MERRRPRTPPARPLVLIVDGHEDTCELYAVVLASFGLETVTVNDGAQAFERVWRTHPDIVVTEIAFPQHDGFHLLKDLKRDARTRDIPVIVLTSRSESDVRERAEQVGCAAVLVKPCLPEDLAHVVRDVLDASSPST